MTSRWNLAQINVGRIREPLDTPLLAGFVAALEPINALADASPGFVWRLVGEGDDATSLRPYPDDDMMLVNMSVWASLEALTRFVYRSAHTEVMRQRRQWFHQMDIMLALWWVPAGHIPTVAEGIERLRHLERHGSTAHAFSFRAPFPAPDATAKVDPVTDECPPP
jgi:hypothetical protein